MTKKNFIKFVGVVSVLCVIFASFALSAGAVKEKNIEYSIDDNKVTIEKFDASGLTHIEIPAVIGECDVVYVQSDAIINGESAVSIHIPASVEDLGEFDSVPFTGMDNLEKITVDENNLYYSSDENGVLYDKSKATIVQYPAGNKNISYSAPDSVTYIKIFSFSGCRYLENVESLGSVDQLCDTFVNCRNLKTVNIPAEVTLVNENNNMLFQGCDSLSDIYFGGSQTQWENLNINPENIYVANAIVHFAVNEDVVIEPAVAEKEEETTLPETTEAETEKETVPTTENSTTEIAATEVSASGDDVTQEKPENQVMKYLVPAAVVLLAAIGIFLVKKYKR